MYREALIKAADIIISFDKEFYYIIWTSLKISFFSVLLSSVFGISIAFILDNAGAKVNRAGKAVLNSLMAIPTVVIGLLVYGILSRSGALGKFGILYTPPAVIIGQSFLVIPVISSFVLSGFSGIDNRLSETLKTLGSSGFYYCISYLNETKVIIATALLAGFGRVIGEVGISMMLGGNIRYYTRTMTTAIALETSKGEFAGSLALGIILIIIALFINFTIHLFVDDGKKAGRL